MIKLIIFDLDGVLVDAKEIHYQSLNDSLKEIDHKYIISREDHIKIYDGLPTIKKLQMISEKKGLSKELFGKIWEMKQKNTINVINNTLTIDNRLREVLRKLKNDGYKIYVASNSIRETLQLMLFKTGLIEFIDYFFSNEDVNNPKPSSEIYLKCLIHAGIDPFEAIILEDSVHGRQAALNSGAFLCPINNVEEVTYENIKLSINKIEKRDHKWESDDIIVLIPMAGAGSRFQQAGYTFPKPLIEVQNKPMIQLVVDSLNIKCKFIYIVQESHYEKYNLKYLLNLLTPNCEIIKINGITEGAACTTLLAKEYINSDKQLIIANSDQFIEWDSNSFYYSLNEKYDGNILTFKSTHPKWSFLKEHEGLITEISEKKPISDIATVGIYHWKKGSDYVKYAEKMISENIRVNNEFYVAPVYNEAIKDGLKFKKFDVDEMWGIGTPEDLKSFQDNYKKMKIKNKKINENIKN